MTSWVLVRRSLLLLHYNITSWLECLRFSDIICCSSVARIRKVWNFVCCLLNILNMKELHHRKISPASFLNCIRSVKLSLETSAKSNTMKNTYATLQISAHSVRYRNLIVKLVNKYLIHIGTIFRARTYMILYSSVNSTVHIQKFREAQMSQKYFVAECPWIVWMLHISLLHTISPSIPLSIDYHRYNFRHSINELYHYIFSPVLFCPSPLST